MNDKPENIRVHYREMLLRLRRIRNICNRVRNSTKEDAVLIGHLRASEKRILEREMPLLGQQLTEMLARGDKVGFLMYTVTSSFGIYMGMFERPRNLEEDVWFLLKSRAFELAGQKIIDFDRLAEYVNTLWNMLELSPTEFSSRLMLLKLSLN